jgi:hypothetical protein
MRYFSILFICFSLLGTPKVYAETGFFGKFLKSQFSDSDYIGRWYQELSFTEKDNDNIETNLHACSTSEIFENHSSNARATMRMSFYYPETGNTHPFKIELNLTMSLTGEWMIKNNYLIEKITNVTINSDSISVDTFGKFEMPEEEKRQRLEALEKMLTEEMKNQSSKDLVKSFDKEKIIYESTDDTGKKSIETYSRTMLNDGKCQ